MPANKLKVFLDELKVKYVNIMHSDAFTAQEIAASAHIPGDDVAKTVIVELDGEMAMAVVPAPYQVDLDKLKKAAGAKEAKLADEGAFKDRFPDCETGAMPPFGNLYDMNVYVAERLAQDHKLAFNAGSHRELFQLDYRTFEELVKPTIAEIT